MVMGTLVRPYLLGDPAYPLLPGLFKAFPGRELPEPMMCFNNKLSGARMCVEKAFGRLKGRWRILTKPLEGSLTSHAYTIGACCILHEICEDDPEAYGHLHDIDDHERRGLTQQHRLERDQARLHYSCPINPSMDASNSASDPGGLQVRDALFRYIAGFSYRSI